MVKIRTADLFVKALENENIEYIFGIPGEENLDLLDALRSSSKIRLILTRHEQAAGFMAATVGRLTGKVGVAISTLGPGATNFATSAAYAQLAGFPMMMITGQKPIRKSKQGSFQIVNIVENMRPLTKYTKQIADGDLVAACVREAVREAEEERPGAVHLELPEDIAEIETDFELFPVNAVRRPIAEEKAIAKAVQMIRAASHPLLLIGAGANRKRTQNMLKQFVDLIGIPFVTTQMGKGVVTEAHPLYMGCCALSVNDYSNQCTGHADLIINVGHDVVEKPPFFMHHGKPPYVIHVNFYSAKVDNVYFPQLEVVGDIANAIYQLKEALKTQQPHWDFSFYLQTKREMEMHLAKGVNDPSFPMYPQRVVAEIRRVVPDDGIVCLDNGMYKIWFARCYKASLPNTLLLDNALATMGAGLPSAMAAALLEPYKKIVAICGDGGFMMNSQELETAVRLKLNFVVIVLNDNAFGMIKWKQNAVGMSNFGLDVGNPDFVKYAESYGAKGYRVTSAEECGEILHQALFLDPPGVKLVEIPINYDVANEILNKELPGLMKETMKEAPAQISTALMKAADEPQTEADKAASSSSSSSSAPASGGVAVPKPVTVALSSSAAAAASSATVMMPPASPTASRAAAFLSSLSPFASKAKWQYREFPFYIANKALYPNKDLEVVNKYSGEVGARVAQAGEKDIDGAIAAATKAVPAMAAMASYERKAVLDKVVSDVKERFDEFAYALAMEAGKPIKDARGEVQRLIDTFSIAAEESVRIYGEWAPLDISQRARGYQSVVRRFPIGVVSMVSPFNFPLNLAAHKIAPALAVGCPFVLKPASRTPLGALMLGDILSKCNLPVGAFSILPCTRTSADLFTTDDRFKLLSFTGSPSVGWEMKAKAGKKKVVLELGGNAAVVVEDLVPDLGTVVDRIIHGGFYQSGQSCISVQRVYIRQDLYERVKSSLVAATAQLKKGDPFEETTFIGPIIALSEAKRIEQWVNNAVKGGAKVLVGGKRDGVFYDATILENVTPDMEVQKEEVFGPVIVLIPYSDFRKAIHDVNESKFGLQAGVFTTDINKAFYAYEHLEVGGVLINDVPSLRVDSQPYGGVKDSGLGREGIRYAMEDMTEIRVLILKDAGKIH